MLYEVNVKAAPVIYLGNFFFFSTAACFNNNIMNAIGAEVKSFDLKLVQDREQTNL